MRHHHDLFKVAALAAAMAVSYPFAAGADQHGDAHSDASGQGAAMDQADTGAPGPSGDQSAEGLRQKTISAEDLMSADVQNLGNPLGNVRDLILNEDGTAVEYILYEVPYPYGALGGAQDGFVAFDNVAVEPTAGFGENIRIDDEASQQAPEELTLTRAEADHRMVSNLLQDTVTFGDDTARQVEDLLIDRETGEITGYVVNKNPDAWFNDEPRMIPADQVQVSQQGDVTTSAEFAALESIE